MVRRPPRATRADTLFPYTTLVRSVYRTVCAMADIGLPSTASDVPTTVADMQAYYDEIAATELAARSEEHTSELQSLMRISYAVFCLTKKKRNKNSMTPQNNHTL